jgi:hypothetical protein
MKTSRWAWKLGQSKKYFSLRQNFLLYPSDNDENNGNVGLVKALRPSITGEKICRVAKDYVYQSLAKIAQKNHITGSYLGLAANRVPEIYHNFERNITDQFVTCQLDQEDYTAVKNWLPYVERAYSPVSFNVEHQDILQYMAETDKKYAILDLDLMNALDMRIIDRITRGVDHCAENRSLVAIWHCSGRSTSDKEIKKVYRPALYKGLGKHFKIKSNDAWHYYEAQTADGRKGYPMRVDVLQLER